jgi:hypothetical protein
MTSFSIKKCDTQQKYIQLNNILPNYTLCCVLLGLMLFFVVMLRIITLLSVVMLSGTALFENHSNLSLIMTCCSNASIMQCLHFKSYYQLAFRA